MGARKAGRPKRRRRGVWGPRIKNKFLRLLRKTGNARAALRVVGHANMFYKRRRRDPVFAAEWAEAVTAADARLGGAESAFVGTGARNCPPRSPRDPAALLRKGEKRKQGRPQAVIRRTSNGRLQITLAREGQVTAEIEADFLARLRATGNFNASARAIGFEPHSLYDRYRKWAAFARDCDAALDAASVQLDFTLVAHAHALLGSPGAEPANDNEPADEVPFDPVTAMRILSFIDRRRGGRTARGPRKGPPERRFEEACESVLSKIEAIERHEEMKKKRAAGGGSDESLPLDGGG
jgi:hypothetical protein